ncbi:MAG: diguanylate cyclase [Defluviitaleaceae bacterium]|nr:diguanylate cyclase [Defluviitaleaceae bacterium]
MDKQQNSVLVVDGDDCITSALTDTLSSMYTIYVAKDGKSAITAALEFMPDLILLNVTLSDKSGFEIIYILKQNSETKDIPVILLSGTTSQNTEEQGLTLGAADYIYKPFNPSIMKLRVKNQIKIVNQMRMIRHYSTTDTLTGLANRMHFNERLNNEWVRATRDNAPIGLLLMDIDNFKEINDTYGHLCGDMILQNTANNIKRCLNRLTDLAARWGGEEFAVLLPNTDLEGAAFVSERIRVNIEKQIHYFEGKVTTPATISVGINCTIPTQKDCINDFVSEADKALYRAKREGKNRIRVVRMSS